VYFDDVLAALSKAHFEQNRKLDIGKIFEFKGKNSQSVITSKTTEHSNIASEKIPKNKEKSIFISSDLPFSLEEFTVAHYLAADLIWEAWERKKRSQNADTSMSSLCFYDRNFYAFTQNEELQETVRQFMKHHEEKASVNKHLLSSKKSAEVGLINNGSLELKGMKYSSAHEQEESVSYSDDRVVPTSFPIDTLTFLEDRLLSVVKDDPDSSVVKEQVDIEATPQPYCSNHSRSGNGNGNGTAGQQKPSSSDRKRASRFPPASELDDTVQLSKRMKALPPLDSRRLVRVFNFSPDRASIYADQCVDEFPLSGSSMASNDKL
jgi:hypothetical protein